MGKPGNKLKVFSVSTFFLVIFSKNCQSDFTNALLAVILSHVVVRVYCLYTVDIITKCT